MDSLPKLIPTWHDVALQDLIRQKNFLRLQCLKPPDFGSVGLDVKCDSNVFEYEALKHSDNQIHLGSDSCALPFFPLKKSECLNYS